MLYMVWKIKSLTDTEMWNLLKDNIVFVEF
jgi:hypothetical protein